MSVFRVLVHSELCVNQNYAYQSPSFSVRSIAAGIECHRSRRQSNDDDDNDDKDDDDDSEVTSFSPAK